MLYILLKKIHVKSTHVVQTCVLQKSTVLRMVSISWKVRNHSFFNSTYCYSVTKLCPTLCNPMDCSMPGFPVLHYSRNLLKLMSTESVMPSKHLIILCCPLLFLPSIFSSIRVFSNGLSLHIRWPKYWSFSISPSNVYSGLISFKIDSFDILPVQRTLKTLQHNIHYASFLDFIHAFVKLWMSS